jgi:hypothetical protein
MGLFSKRIPKKLVKRILDSIVEGNTYLVIPSYIFLVRTRGSYHLNFDRYFRRSFFFESCIYGRSDLVRISITESPLRGQLITQDLVDTAFLITCAQDKPSIDVLRVLLLSGGADCNSRWDLIYYLRGSKEQERSTRKKKKRSRYFKKYLSRYINGGRVMMQEDTPLILACRKRSEEHRSRDKTSHLIQVIQFLKDNGADHLLKNNLGHDAMTVAIDTAFFRVLFEQHKWLDPDMSRLLQFLNDRKLEKTTNENSFLLLLCYSFDTTNFTRDMKKRCSGFIEEWQQTMNERERPYVFALKKATTPEVEVGTRDENNDNNNNNEGQKVEDKVIEQKIADAEIKAAAEEEQEEKEEEWEAPEGREERIQKFKRQIRKDRKKRLKNIHLVYKYVLDNKNPKVKENRPELQLLRDEDSLKQWAGSAASISADRCRLTHNELIPFLAFLLLDAARRGIMPNNHWTQQFDTSLAKTLRNLGDISTVCAFLHQRCAPLLATFVRHDIFRFPRLLKRSGETAAIGWPEMLPMIQSLYCLMWRASLPEHPGSDEFVSAELDRDIVKAKANHEVHYYTRLKKNHITDEIAPLPNGWQYTEDVTGGYYSNTSSRKTSLERPTNVGRSFA